MNLKTIDRIADLHQETLDNRYPKTTWWAMLKQSVEPAELQELISSAKMGLDYLLANEDVEALAVSTFPWMTNELEYVYQYGPNKGTKGMAPSWLSKMKENKSPQRPKDLVHLAKICEIAENIDAYDDMF